MIELGEFVTAKGARQDKTFLHLNSEMSPSKTQYSHAACTNSIPPIISFQLQIVGTNKQHFSVGQPIAANNFSNSLIHLSNITGSEFALKVGGQ